MMRRITLALLILMLSARSWGLERISDEQIAQLHWMPQTAEQALLRSHALALWLAEQPEEMSDWRRQVDLRLLNLEREAQRWQPLLASPVDGLLAWLVQQRNEDLTVPATAERAREALLAAMTRPDPSNPAPLHTRWAAERLWAELRARLRAAGLASAELELPAVG